jgi:UDP-glucose 4-epimerase
MSERMNAPSAAPAGRVAILGASGFIGRLVTRVLLRDHPTLERLLLVDIAPPAAGFLDPRLHDELLDIRSARLAELFGEHQVDTVIHLASIVTPPRRMSRQEQYAIDVDGMHNVLEACLAAGVVQVVVMSSAAAYGFAATNPPRLDEQAPLRADKSFPYAWHKRLVEEILARYREQHPELWQLVFRPATVLGPGTHHPVADVLARRVLPGIAGWDAPFAFISGDDVAACVLRGVLDRRVGIFNLVADGTVDPREVTEVTGALYLPLPVPFLRWALAVLREMGLTQYGPRHVDYLRNRPLLANDALKQDFGFTPTHTSRETLEVYWRWRSAQRS